MFNRIINNCKESYDELVHKVTWPSYKELTNSAVIVLSASIVIALVVFVIDTCFENMMSLVYSIF